jgi:prevent-host-death family protein
MSKPNRDQKGAPGAAPGQPVGSSISATEAQNNFGRVLSQAASEGVVFITKYERPEAVVLSMDRYNDLVRFTRPDLQGLAREFDEMLAQMQTPDAASAFDALFEAGEEELGQAAVRGAHRRRA